MVKHTQTIRLQQATNYLSVFDHFGGLALKVLIIPLNISEIQRSSDIFRGYKKNLGLKWINH